ncbi:MAG: single-stranded-DNA-specific exonuclease RecJ [Hyphomicrobiales bacterium]|nr:single-stranded-DNA-specific exonuclease RecJ [Hyphomicrobiales bacterium]
MNANESSQKAEFRPFLGVERSLSGRAWIERLDRAAANAAKAIAERHALPELIARVLAGRGVAIDEAPDFLAPSLKALLPDPDKLTDMPAAAARIADAVTAGEKIAIFADYDVDGATSAALLTRFLRMAGVEPRIYVPDRIFEGYGPTPAAIDTLIEGGASLIVTVDCGVTSFEALEHAKERGVDVVVLDHHQVGAELPPAVAVVNPNRADDLSGQGHLAAVGVTLLTAIAVNRRLRDSGYYGNGHPEPDLLSLLDLAALGTVADVVPLKDLNRAIVTKGLVPLRRRANAGLAALADVVRLSGPIAPYHLGFLLGPRINAGGRIGDAGLGARLLVTDDPIEAGRIAAELHRLNAERQAIETATLEAADAEAGAEIGAGEGPSVLLTQGDDWHPGVVGLVASRLKDRYRRPAFAVAFDREGIGTGSGRSIPGADLGRAVRAAVDRGLLEKGGGHAMAAGITVRRTAIRDLRTFFEDTLGEAVAAARARDGLKVDGALTATSATIDLIGMIERAGPYGAGHPEPIFAFPAHRVTYAKVVGSTHVQATIASGAGDRLKAIAFRAADQPLGRALLDARNGPPLHLAGTLSLDHWGGSPRVQLRIIDAAEVKR